MISRHAKISVIVPAYNAEKFIAKCINSIRAQSHGNMEIVVVDDASSDRTGEVLGHLAAQDQRVRPFRAEHNLGVHGARRLALEHATGDLVGFVDADDYIEPSMYLQLHQALVERRAEIAMCSASSVVDGRVIGTKVAFRSEKLFTSNVLARFCSLKFGSGVLWNKLYVRGVIEAPVLVELERAVDASEDYIVNFGAFARASSVVTSRARLYNYVLHPENASAAGKPWDSFARLLRAYVVCLELYAQENRSYSRMIDELYLKQLHFPVYKAGGTQPTDAVREHLAESLRRLASSSPESIYYVLHSLPKWESRLRRTLSSLKRF